MVKFVIGALLGAATLMVAAATYEDPTPGVSGRQRIASTISSTQPVGRLPIPDLLS